MMKAARLHKVGEPFHIEEVPVPHLDSGEVLVQVKFCGICGSDLQRVTGITSTAYLPITLGHEISGEVAAVSKEIKKWNVGDRVTFSGVLNCGFCNNCLNGKDYICENRKFIGIHAEGGFAQFVKAKADKLVRLPPAVSFEEGALIEPAGSPFHALTRRAKLTLGITILLYLLHSLTSCGLRQGPTMNSAPARIDARAVSGSSTEPAPKSISSPASLASLSITPIAPGTVIVISIVLIPPFLIASTTFRASSADLALMTGITPPSSIIPSFSLF